jgi:hypothetical protein
VDESLGDGYDEMKYVYESGKGCLWTILGINALLEYPVTKEEA